MKHIRQGNSVIDSQLSVGCESASGFRDAFSKIMGEAPSRISGNHCLCKASWLDTPLGPMLAIADDHGLYLLEFVNRRGLEREIERFRSRVKAIILPEENAIIFSIKQELERYFQGRLTHFKTPIHLLGSPFQQSVWRVLQSIPYGETRSYQQQAENLRKPKAYRAVANANGANQLAIIIPCHRIINSNGELGGYGGGVARKQWLIEHENKWALKHESTAKS